jgi:hypothetical protein
MAGIGLHHEAAHAVPREQRRQRQPDGPAAGDEHRHGIRQGS